MSRHRAEGPRAPWQEGTREALSAAGLDPQWVRELVVRALAEDLGPSWADVTTTATVAPESQSQAEVVARDSGTIAGLVIWPVIMAETAARLGLAVPTAEIRVRDGESVGSGDVLVDLQGPTAVLLVAQGTALNLTRHASAVATHAAAWVGALAGTRVTLLDSRCTTPGLRPLERYAVRCAGGLNGREGLFDAAHVTVQHTLAAGGVSAALDAVRQRLPGALVQVDIADLDQGLQAVQAGARFVVCDHMKPSELADCVAGLRGSTDDALEIAASGDYGVEQAAEIAASGVNHLYVDGLVTNAPAIDVAVVTFPPLVASGAPDATAGYVVEPGQ